MLQANPAVTSKDEAAVRALQDAWATAFRHRDAAALAALYTDDCIRMPDGGPTIAGRAALEAAYQRELEAIGPSPFTFSLTTDAVVVSGNHAFARGTDTFSRETNGKTVSETGKWMATYRREPGGVWKYLWSTYNSNR